MHCRSEWGEHCRYKLNSAEPRSGGTRSGDNGGRTIRSVESPPSPFGGLDSDSSTWGQPCVDYLLVTAGAGGSACAIVTPPKPTSMARIRRMTRNAGCQSVGNEKHTTTSRAHVDTRQILSQHPTTKCGRLCTTSSRAPLPRQLSWYLTHPWRSRALNTRRGLPNYSLTDSS
eukprot:3569933-Rhodomonas_salina.1